ncbi:MAG: PAS domain S-box protein, partial [Gemmataceae bacterium]|nr:PAS domain S-box protein [Gemmataceae bacterium]
LRLTTADIDDPAFAAGFRDRLQQQLSLGQLRCEGRHRTRDGRLVPVDINTSAILLNGRPAILAVMRDITDRKRAEEQLRKQTDLLQSILVNMTDGVIVADEQGRLLAFNPAAERLFGLSRADVGSAEWSWRSAIYLSDAVTPYPGQELPLARAVRGEPVAEVELFVRHPRTPRGHWVSITGGPLRDALPGATAAIPAWADPAVAGAGALHGGVIVCRDITERKRAEQRLAAQHAVTRALACAASVEDAGPEILHAICEGLGWDVAALWTTNPGDTVLRCAATWHRPRPQVERFVEATRPAVFAAGVGLPGRVWVSGAEVWIPDLAADENFSRLGPAVRASLHTGFAFPVKVGGETVGVVEAFGGAIDRPDDDLLSMAAALGAQIGQVFERQRVEKALRQSEAFYHSLVESLPQNIFRKDLDGRVTFGNRRYCATLERPLEELIGKTDFDLFPPDLAAKYRQDDRTVQETGQALEAVEEHLLPDHSKIYVQVIKTAIRDSAGKVIGTQGMFWDVTERRRAEEAVAESARRYRQLTEATLDAIVVADRTGRIILFNPAAERAFGYQAQEVVGQPLDLLIPPEYVQRHREGFQRYLETGQARFVGRTAELHGLRKDNTTFPLELALSAVKVGEVGPDGRPAVHFLGAIRDLTERNRIRAVAIQNEKLAAIGLLSAGVAHEINNPLAFVANNLAVLERDYKGLVEIVEVYREMETQLAQLNAEAAARVRQLADEADLDYIRANLPRLLARTRDGVDRVTRIVHSLRGLARTDTPRKQDAYLPDLVDTSLEIIRGRMKRRGIELETDYDPVSRVRCVSSQISQVLLNLLVNALQAVEATPPSHPGRIRVRTRRAGEEMLVEVADNGCGIDSDHLSRLFDPFFTTKEVGEGTGLGLSITHNIVAGHGGRIEVDSRPGEGTCFRIYLPIYGSREGP